MDDDLRVVISRWFRTIEFVSCEYWSSIQNLSSGFASQFRTKQILLYVSLIR